MSEGSCIEWVVALLEGEQVPLKKSFSPVCLDIKYEITTDHLGESEEY